MTTFAATKRLWTVTTPLGGEDVLLLVGFTGHEGLSQLFQFHLDLVALNNKDIPFDKLLGQKVSIGLVLSNNKTRYFHGICSRVSQGVRDATFTAYRMEVVPQAEVWGFSKTLGKLSEAVMVAIESDHPKACVLADVYHLYRGGSGFNGLKLLGPATMFVCHFNDYPAQPPREQITDAQRVYPGDGVAPLKEIIRDLLAAGFTGVLSLELFNRDYWKQDALAVARTGLEKMKAAVQAAQA